MRRPKHRILRTGLLGTLVLAVTTSILVPRLVHQHRRSRAVSELSSPNETRREEALNYLIRHAKSDPTLLKAALQRLSQTDSLNTLQVLNALRFAGVLGRPPVVDAAAQRMATVDAHWLNAYYYLFLESGLGDHPELVDLLLKRLGTKDETAFLAVVSLLEAADQWQHPPVPAPAFLRWLSVLGSRPDAATRTVAAERAGRGRGLADDRQLVGLLATWLVDIDAAVREAALLSAAELAGASGKRDHLVQLFAKATRNSDPALARRAWVLLGLLGAASDAGAPLLDTRPSVAHAMLWALNPDVDAFDQLIPAVQDPSLRRRLVGMSAYAAATRAETAATDAVTRHLDTQLAALGDADDATLVMLWRLLLSLAAAQPQPDAPAKKIYERCRTFAATQDRLAPLSVVAAYCDPKDDDLTLDQARRDPQRFLAAVEGLRVNERVVPVLPDAPLVSRLAAVSVSSDPKAHDLMPALTSDETALRDVACFVAFDRFSKEQNAQLAADLLLDYSDNAKQSGAILAGLCGVQQDLLRKKANDEDVWAVRQVLRLGLWMQSQRVEDVPGHPLDMPKLASTLLTRDDLSWTTVILAIMWHDREAPQDQGDAAIGLAWDTLLSPRLSGTIDLEELLAAQRWWQVLSRFVPDAPPFWVWADAELQSFQIEVLRCWYVLNRTRH